MIFSPVGQHKESNIEDLLKKHTNLKSSHTDTTRPTTSLHPSDHPSSPSDSLDLSPSTEDTRASALKTIKERLMAGKHRSLSSENTSSNGPLKIDTHTLTENYSSLPYNDLYITSPKSILKESKFKSDFGKRLSQTPTLIESPKTVSFKESLEPPKDSLRETPATVSLKLMGIAPKEIPENAFIEERPVPLDDKTDSFPKLNPLSKNTHFQIDGTNKPFVSNYYSEQLLPKQSLEKPAGLLFSKRYDSTPSNSKPTEPPVSDSLAEMVQNTVHDCMQEYLFSFKQDMQNIHVEILKQFHQQKVI